MENLQQQVQEAIDELVESGAERGLQVAVYRDGEQVVDAVAGVADPETGRPVASDTPFYAYSVGKGATATVAHVLVERGLFDYDTPIVELWPEFGAHGKESATVRHALTHTVGVPGIPADTTPEDLCDWDRMCAAIADSEPWWEPGTETAYHAYPFGYIVGEIVRRATGKPISQVLREEVAGPLGRRRRALLRHARVRASAGWPGWRTWKAAPSFSPRCRTIRRSSSWGRGRPPRPPSSATAPTYSWPTSPPAARPRRAPWPACTPRCWARWTACGSSRRSGCARSPPWRSAVSTRSWVTPSTWALGYSIGQLGSDAQETPTVFGMGGVGGSFAYADTATGVAFALTKNRLTADFSAAQRISGIVTEAVGG